MKLRLGWMHRLDLPEMDGRRIAPEVLGGYEGRMSLRADGLTSSVT